MKIFAGPAHFDFQNLANFSFVSQMQNILHAQKFPALKHTRKTRLIACFEFEIPQMTFKALCVSNEYDVFPGKGLKFEKWYYQGGTQKIEKWNLQEH